VFERSEASRDRSLATNGCRTGAAFWGRICCCCCCSVWLHKGSPPTGVLNCPAVRFTIPAAGLWIWCPNGRLAVPDRSLVSVSGCRGLTVFIPPTPTPTPTSSGAPARLIPGWFVPTVGARSALRLSLSYCAYERVAGESSSSPQYIGNGLQTFSF